MWYDGTNIRKQRIDCNRSKAKESVLEKPAFREFLTFKQLQQKVFPYVKPKLRGG